MDKVRKIKHLNSRIKKFIYVLCIIQWIFIIVGIVYMFNNNIKTGLCHIFVSLLGFIINLNTLKKINKG